MTRGLLNKIFEIFSTFFWTTLFLLKTTGVWRVKKSTIVEGRVIIRSLQGDAKFGKNLRIGSIVNLASTKGAVISIGDNVSINQGCYIICRNKITIGDNTRIGEYSSIRDNTHQFSNLEIPIFEQDYSSKPVFIGNDVWIGRAVTIMPGVMIGDGAVIGSHSVVVKNVPMYAVFAGVPAREIGHRNR